MPIDAGWISHRAATPDPVPLNPGAVARLDALLHGWAAVFAERREDVASGAFRHGSRGLGNDEATSFLRGVDGGQLAVDEAGYVVPLCVLPKKRPQRYALCCKSGDGVTVNLEYLIQLGVMAELHRDLDWPVAQLRVELSEFDGSIVDEQGAPLLVMEAKCRRSSGQDTLAQLLSKWVRFAEAEEPPTRGENSANKYLDLLRITEHRRTVGVLLVADGARWWLNAERADGHRLRFEETDPAVRGVLPELSRSAPRSSSAPPPTAQSPSR